MEPIPTLEFPKLTSRQELCDPTNARQRERWGCLTQDEILEWIVRPHEWPDPDLPVRVLACESRGRAISPRSWTGGKGLFQLTGYLRKKYPNATGDTPNLSLEQIARAAGNAAWDITNGGQTWRPWYGGSWPSNKEKPASWNRSYWGSGPGGSRCWNY